MKEHQFDSNVESIYISLSDEEKKGYKKQQDKFNKSFLVLGIVLTAILFALIVGAILLSFVRKEYDLLILSGIALLFFIFSITAIIKPSVIGLKSSDETAIKMCIERLEKQKEQIAKTQEEKLKASLQKNVYYRLSVDNIKLVTILDSYTEVSDKLHAILNYQEIIQTRIYKFKVDYNDGTSTIVTAAEGSEEYSVLITRVKSATASKTDSSDNNIEKLREYKQLLDEGIITQEEFETKKKEFL